MNHLERFLGVMEYQAVDQVPNWEAGAWPQALARWEQEGMDPAHFHGNWFSGEAALGQDPREFIPWNGDLLPGFEPSIITDEGDTVLERDHQGRVRRALKAGTIGWGRMSMDTYLSFPVDTMEDWQNLKPRFNPHDARRYEANWQTLRAPYWPQRQHPLIFAPNAQTQGFYWLARELMGTEPVSYAWYDQPQLMHDMMEFWCDFQIEGARPILETTTIEYICLAEDLAMKTGPLISPELYRIFILPRLRRLIEFYKSHGVRYVVIDSDGNFEVLLGMMMDVGVDATWPLERPASMDPYQLRRKFGRQLRLWGGFDKMVLGQGPEAIDAHWRELAPLVQEGGFIPTVDHTVPPDVSWDQLGHYMRRKAEVLRGDFA